MIRWSYNGKVTPPRSGHLALYLSLIRGQGHNSLLVNKSGYSLATLQLRLFKNNVTPGETDTAATYTEDDFTGYSSAAMASADWTLTPGAPSQAVGAQKTFTSSADQAAQTIYGYYLTENGSNTLVAAEAFAASVSIANNGDNIKVTPTITQA